MGIGLATGSRLLSPIGSRFLHNAIKQSDSFSPSPLRGGGSQCRSPGAGRAAMTGTQRITLLNDRQQTWPPAPTLPWTTSNR